MEGSVSNAVDEPGPGCEAFDPKNAGVFAEAASLRRFLVGRDERPTKGIEEAEREQELNDPFAVELLRQGTFPTNAEDVMAKLDESLGEGHPLSAGTQRTFVVGEGSQIAKDPKKSFRRRLRFLATRGQGEDGPDLLVSAFDPRGTDVEVMAWDDRNGGFNYYRTIAGEQGSWVWAGNSRHAWEPGTRASGPFEAHPAGHFLFKELKFPWVHWHGPPALIDDLDFEQDDDLSTHAWFKDKQGAYVLEPLAELAVKRWNRRRLSQVREAGTIVDPKQFMERFLGSTIPERITVNLISSTETNAELADIERVRLPVSFFIDKDGLSGVLGLDKPPELSVSASDYRDLLAKFNVVVRNHDQVHPLDGEEEFERPGDTHFLFVVPERAFEDTDFVRQVVKPRSEDGESELGVISERLVASLLMVDFPNPVFSTARVQLLDHVQAEPLPATEWPSFSERLGDKIADAGRGDKATEAEQQFARLWEAGEEGWRTAASELLQTYYEQLPAQLESPEGLEDVFKLAEERRRRVHMMPISETPLLFAQSDISSDEAIKGLAMQPDGSVERRSNA